MDITYSQYHGMTMMFVRTQNSFTMLQFKKKQQKKEKHQGQDGQVLRCQKSTTICHKNVFFQLRLKCSCALRQNY